MFAKSPMEEHIVNTPPPNGMIIRSGETNQIIFPNREWGEGRHEMK